MRTVSWNYLWVGTIVVLAVALSLSHAIAEETPPLAFEWRHHENGVYLAGSPWSPNNQYLAVSSLQQDAILLIDRETWDVARRLELPSTELPLARVRWSPNGNYIAVATYAELIVLSVQEGDPVRLTQLLSAMEGVLLEMRWMGDTDALAVLDNAGKIHVINVATQEVIGQIEFDDYPAAEWSYNTFDWSPHASLFAAPLYSSNTIGFWEMSGNIRDELVRESAPNANRFASQCGAWRPERASSLEFDFSQLGGNIDLLDIEWSNDGTRIVLTASYNVVVCALNQQMTEVSNLRQLRIPNPLYDPTNINLQNPYNIPFEVTWSPDDRWLLASQFYIPPQVPGDSCGIPVFDTQNDFAYVGEIGEQFCHVWDMSWTPDGRLLSIGTEATGYWVGTLRSERIGEE